MPELVDLISYRDEVIGTVDKDIAHMVGALHRAVHLWIVCQDENGIGLILQRRGMDKKLLPGKFDVSAAGHLLAGEAPLEGMLRECEEELGFRPEASALTALGRRVELYEDDTVKNFEVCYVYLMRSDRPLSEYQTGYPELDGVCRMELEDLRELLTGRVPTAPVCGIFWDEAGMPHTQTLQITCDDFVPRLDSYMEKLVQLIPAYLSGEKLLYI